MSKKLELDLNGSFVNFTVRRLLVAGYTGRDAMQVQAHIAELERHGIPPPEKAPTLWAIDPAWATTNIEIDVTASQVSGEAEPALLFYGNDLQDALVSLGVDFTDRAEERRSIAFSKEQPKPLSRRVWRYRDVAAAWDEIALRSWVGDGPDRRLYQRGTLSELLDPRSLLERLSLGLDARLEGTVLLMGTLPLRSAEFSFGEYFGCEMEAPERQVLSYECRFRGPILAGRD
jgi:hypothetical protein